MSEGVDTGGLDKLQKALEQLAGPLLTKFKGSTAYTVALAIQGVIEPYGKAIKHTPVIWASKKQRRWYFAARRAAGLSPEYVRGSDRWSQRVSQSWTIRRRPEESTLGNRATYAPYVASDEFQTEQHAATGFTTDKQAADKVLSDGTVGRIVDAQIKAIVKEAFRGL